MSAQTVVQAVYLYKSQCLLTLPKESKENKLVLDLDVRLHLSSVNPIFQYLCSSKYHHCPYKLILQEAVTECVY